MTPRNFIFPSSNLSFIFLLTIFYQYFLLWVNAEICPENTDTVAKLLSASGITAHRKSCPDFKDDTDQSSCCPSSITPGTYYCCTLEKREEIDDELAAEARRIFFRNHLAQIIIGSILSLVIFIVVTSIVCKRVKWCPMYNGKSINTPSSHQIISNSSYRPVDTIPPKPPSVYEAPPPYDFTTAHQQQQQSSNQFSSNNPHQHHPQLPEHDWNCLVENEINDARSSFERRS